MNLPSGESLARQIVYGQRCFESRFGARCTEVWIPDVFGYPASLPQLYAAGGMHRFVTQKLSWNKTEPLPPPHLLVGGPRRHPGADPLPAGRHLQRRGHARRMRRAPRNGSSTRVVATGRSCRSATATAVADRPGRCSSGPAAWPTSTARRRCRSTRRPSSSSDVERELAGTGAPVPVWRGELYFETHRGTLTSQLRTKTGNRRCERLLREVELWAATAGVRPTSTTCGARCSPSSSTTSSPARRSPGCTTTPRRCTQR